MKRITCPFCGEEIAATAKKCRFCGEWLPDPQFQETMIPPLQEAEVAEALEVNTDTDCNNVPAISPTYPVTENSDTPAIAPVAAPGQTIQSVGGQPIVVNVVNQQSVEQTQTVIVQGGNSGKAPGWIFGEMWLIAAGIGFALSSWWWFLGVAVIGSVLLLVPFIGALMCVIIGVGWGLIAGAIGAGLFSNAAGWVIGILVGAGAIYGHLEARKANMEEE